jgi:polyhydroxyalkanoate synthesis regulator phasin
MKFPLKEDVDKLTEQVTILSERIKKLEETTRQNP